MVPQVRLAGCRLYAAVVSPDPPEGIKALASLLSSSLSFPLYRQHSHPPFLAPRTLSSLGGGLVQHHRYLLSHSTTTTQRHHAVRINHHGHSFLGPALRPAALGYMLVLGLIIFVSPLHLVHSLLVLGLPRHHCKRKRRCDPVRRRRVLSGGRPVQRGLQLLGMFHFTRLGLLGLHRPLHLFVLRRFVCGDYDSTTGIL